MHHIPWMLKTCQTMGNAGMPPTSKAAMASPRLGSARARASAKGISSGANSLCTREEVTCSPWAPITKVQQGKANLIHVEPRKDICWSPALTVLCRLQNRAEPTSFMSLWGIQNHSGHIFQGPGNCNLGVGREVPLQHSQAGDLNLMQGWAAHTHTELSTRQVRSG